MEYNITSKEQAKELGRIGGSRSSFAKSFTKRQYCDSKCEMWDAQCPYIQYSLADANKVKVGKKHRYKCVLKSLNQKAQNRAVNILLGGEDGIKNFMKQFVIELGNKADSSKNAKEMAMAFDKGAKYFELVYAKQRHEIDGNMNVGITAEHFRMAEEEINGNNEEED